MGLDYAVPRRVALKLGFEFPTAHSRTAEWPTSDGWHCLGADGATNEGITQLGVALTFELTRELGDRANSGQKAVRKCCQDADLLTLCPKAMGWTPPDGIEVPEWRC